MLMVMMNDFFFFMSAETRKNEMKMTVQIGTKIAKNQRRWAYFGYCQPWYDVYGLTLICHSRI